MTERGILRDGWSTLQGSRLKLCCTRVLQIVRGKTGGLAINQTGACQSPPEVPSGSTLLRHGW